MLAWASLEENAYTGYTMLIGMLGDHWGGDSTLADWFQRLLQQRYDHRAGLHFSQKNPQHAILFLGTDDWCGDHCVLYVPHVVHDLYRQASRSTCFTIMCMNLLLVQCE